MERRDAPDASSGGHIDARSNCKNCGETLHGLYCCECGQRNIPGRLNLVDLSKNALLAAFDLESTFWRTFREMNTAPGQVALNYIHGQRFRYVNPLKYFFWTFAIYLAVLAGTGAQGIVADDIASAGENFQFAEGADLAELLRSVMQTHVNLVSLLAIPMFALLIRWQFYRSGRNFAETLSFIAFVYGQSYIAGIMIALIFAPFSYYSQIPRALVLIALFYFGVRTFFQTRNWPSNTGAVLITVVLYLLSSTLAANLVLFAKYNELI